MNAATKHSTHCIALVYGDHRLPPVFLSYFLTRPVNLSANAVKDWSTIIW